MRKRITILSITITTIAILLFSVASALILYDNSINEAEQHLSVYIQLSDNYTTDQQGADQFSTDTNGARVTYIALDGTVIADSAYDSSEMDNHITRPEVAEAIQYGSGYAVRYSDTLHSNLVYYCVCDGTIIVRIALYTSSIWDIYIDALPLLLAVLALDILICLLLVWLSTSYILYPVHQLTVNATTEENFSTPYKELQPLTEQLRQLHYNNKLQVQQLNREKETIQQVHQSKQEFTSNVTHEMNTPLTSIKGYAEWLVSGKLNDQQIVNSSRIIAAQADRLSNLIKCIIDYNQIDNDNVDLYEVNISVLANDIINTLLPSIVEHNLELTTNIADNVTVISRQERMTQVIGNLVRNAIKYNKPNGLIDITITGGNKPQIIVRDTGIGIAPENHEKIFSRFFTVDKSHGGQNGGFGLGLAVARRICNRQGWTIFADSTLGEGTTFTVTMTTTPPPDNGKQLDNSNNSNM